MIEELRIAIDEADKINSKKSKEILLKIAMLKEENQQAGLDLVKLLINVK